MSCNFIGKKSCKPVNIRHAGSKLIGPPDGIATLATTRPCILLTITSP